MRAYKFLPSVSRICSYVETSRKIGRMGRRVGRDQHVGWIFRKGDAGSAKLVTLVLFTLLCVALYGLINRHNLVPVTSLRYPAMAFGTLCALFASIALCRDTNSTTPFAKLGPIKRTLFLIGVAFPLMWAMGYFAALLGAPSICAILSLDPKAAHVPVEYVFRERRGRGCQHRILISGGPLPEAMTPCVSEQVWQGVTVGRNVNITYTDGFGAFVVHDVELTK